MKRNLEITMETRNINMMKLTLVFKSGEEIAEDHDREKTKNSRKRVKVYHEIYSHFKVAGLR